jgi:hypothetical protein
LGQSNIQPIGNLKVYSVAPNEDTLEKYRNTYPDNIQVVIKNNALYFTTERIIKDSMPSFIKLTRMDSLRLRGSLSVKVRGNITVLEVSDGYLIAGNQGEFGGSLYWFSKTDTTRYLIRYGNVISFLKRKDKIFAIEGLAHGSACRGEIMELKEEAEKWTASTFINLNSAPFAVSPYKRKSFIVLTASGMYLIDKKKRIKALIDGDLWEYSLYPNSLVIKNKIIYAGVGIGIIKYDLATNKEEWLLPDNPVLLHPKAQ